MPSDTKYAVTICTAYLYENYESDLTLRCHDSKLQSINSDIHNVHLYMY